MCSNRGKQPLLKTFVVAKLPGRRSWVRVRIDSLLPFFFGQISIYQNWSLSIKLLNHCDFTKKITAHGRNRSHETWRQSYQKRWKKFRNSSLWRFSICFAQIPPDIAEIFATSKDFNSSRKCVCRNCLCKWQGTMLLQTKESSLYHAKIIHFVCILMKFHFRWGCFYCCYACAS